jgi:aquaporin Z
MKKYVNEFIGTFFLILVIAFTGNPIAIGIVLAALVYMGGYISGAHYNPAVTLAIWLTKKIDSHTAVRYMAIQLIAGIAAAGVYFLIHGSKFIPSPGHDVSMFSALAIEILFTFLLASVVLHVAATDKTKGNDYFGLAIGFTVLAGAFAGGPISGGAFNPAVGISPILFDITNISSHLPNLFLYLVGPLVGGALASVVYKMK